MKNQKGFVHFLLIITILLIGIGGIGYFAYKNGLVRINNSLFVFKRSPSLIPDSTNKISPTISFDQEWNRYKSDLSGYSIKLPPDANFAADIPPFDEPTKNLLVGHIKIIKGRQQLRYQELNKDKTWHRSHMYNLKIRIESWTDLEAVNNFDKWVNKDIETLSNILNLDQPKKIINLDGNEAAQISFIKTENNWKYIYMYFQNNDRFYRIYGIIDLDREDENCNLFNQILSTFKFEIDDLSTINPHLSPSSDTDFGTVSGSVSYPSEMIPADLKICADNIFNKKTICNKWSHNFDLKYSIKLPVGNYYIYESSEYMNSLNSNTYKAYYSRVTLCKKDTPCNDHTPILITVKKGETIVKVDPYDWYTYF